MNVIKIAKTEDFEKVVSFYRYVIQNTQDMALYTRWVYGKHPTDSMILEYIAQGSMYLLEEAGTIIAAMAVTLSQGDDYHDIDWGMALKDDEVAVIHIFCVNPDYQRQGIGKKMIAQTNRLAGENGKKAIRLDALASNTPAHAMYESMGFQLRGKKNLYADNTGWTDFLFFERRIDLTK